MKLLPLLAALPLLCASVVSANTLMSVGYFNGGGDVTAGPGGDIDKLDVRQITHLNYSFGLVYNDEKDETNAAPERPGQAASDLAVAESTGGFAENPQLAPAEPKPESVAFRRRLGGARILRRSGNERHPGGVYPVGAGDH